jgi:hypothetical protein
MSWPVSLASAVLAVLVLVALAPGATAATSAVDASVIRAIPCPNGRPIGPRTACTGPVTHRSGGGGGALTIVVSTVVGLTVAAGGFVLVRRRIAEDATRPRPARGERRPS